MLTVFWKGKCPKCGSNKISQYYWGNVCNECGYRSSEKEEKKEELMRNKLRELPTNTELKVKRNCHHYGRTYKKGDIVIKSPDPYRCCIEAIEMPTRRPDDQTKI